MEPPKRKTPVTVKPALESTDGMLINCKHLDVRRPNATGRYIGWVPGHGGDVWWVEHDDGIVAAYSYNEIVGY